jgi:hypothetical protein
MLVRSLEGVVPQIPPSSSRPQFHRLFSVPSAISVLRKTPSRSAPNPCASVGCERSALVSPSCFSSARKSHRITSFADPHRLTSIESYLCKKQGRGWESPRTVSQANPSQLFPQPINIQRTGMLTTPLLSCVYYRFSGHRGYPFPAHVSPSFQSFQAFDCELSTVSLLLLPSPPHPGAIHA